MAALYKICAALTICVALIFADSPSYTQMQNPLSSRRRTEDSPILQGAGESSKETAPRKSIDMVFLVDISKSMDDVFRDVRKSLIDYVQKALVGDHIIIISFGKDACLEVNKSIKKPEDKENIIESIQRIYPRDYSTYIVAAVERGLAELTKRKEEGNTSVRFLFLITDGKNNPPKEITNPLTFDRILRGYKNFRPGQDWFMHYITLKNVEDNVTQDFVRQVGGGIYNVESSSLVNCVNNTQVPVLTRVTDVFDLVEMRRRDYDIWLSVTPDTLLCEGDTVRTGPTGRAVINFSGYGSTGVDEDTEFELHRLRMNPVSACVDISINLLKGRLTNILEDLPARSSNFKITTPGAAPQVGSLDSVGG